jgi:hypothetical protein
MQSWDHSTSRHYLDASYWMSDIVELANTSVFDIPIAYSGFPILSHQAQTLLLSLV